MSESRVAISIETALFGVLTFEDLERIIGGSQSGSQLLTIQWHKDASEVISRTKDLGFQLNANAEEFLFNIKELGSMSLKLEGLSPIEPKGIIELSIVPSFRIRLHLALDGSGGSLNLEAILSAEKERVQRLINALSKEGLSIKDCVIIINVKDGHNLGTAGFLKSAASVFGEPHSASLIGSTVLFRKSSESLNYFLIFNMESRQLLIDLYFLRIAKEKLRELLGAVEDFRSRELHGLRSSMLKNEARNGYRESNVNGLLSVREKVLNLLHQFRLLKKERELTLMFIDTNLSKFFSAKEEPAYLDKSGVIERENYELEFYYLKPLEHQVLEVESELLDLKDYLTDLSEIYSILANIKLQRIIMIFTVILSALTMVMLVFSFFHL